MVRIAGLMLLGVLATGACATAPAPTLDVTGPAIVLAAPTSGPDVQVAAYVRIRNPGAADRLLGVACACADAVEIHNTFDRQMHTLESLEAPANSDLEIRPGGPTHLMLMGLHAPIAAGEHIPMTLTFERAGERRVEFVAVENSREAWAAHDTSH